MEEDDTADAVRSRVELTTLLRMAAGLSASACLGMAAYERETVNDRGLRCLVEAAGLHLGEWIDLDEFSPARSDVLLAGARMLGIPTSWKGWG